MKKTFLLIALSALSFSAYANELPRYDVPASCQEVANFGGGSHQIYNSCIQMEQQAYNNLKNRWAGIPNDIRGSCIEVASFGGNSYQILESCIQMEQGAADNPETFSFD
jgi:hypothetical protein